MVAGVLAVPRRTSTIYSGVLDDFVWIGSRLGNRPIEIVYSMCLKFLEAFASKKKPQSLSLSQLDHTLNTLIC